MIDYFKDSVNEMRNQLKIKNNKNEPFLLFYFQILKNESNTLKRSLQIGYVR